MDSSGQIIRKPRTANIPPRTIPAKLESLHPNPSQRPFAENPPKPSRIVPAPSRAKITRNSGSIKSVKKGPEANELAIGSHLGCPSRHFYFHPGNVFPARFPFQVHGETLSRFWNSFSRLKHQIQVKRNGLGNEFAHFLHRVSGSDTTWKIGHHGAIIIVLAVYPDQKTHFMAPPIALGSKWKPGLWGARFYLVFPLPLLYQPWLDDASADGFPFAEPPPSRLCEAT